MILTNVYGFIPSFAASAFSASLWAFFASASEAPAFLAPVYAKLPWQSASA